MKFMTVLVLLSITGTLTADSAVMFEYPDGRSVALISSGEITMAWESVTIVPAEEQTEFDKYLANWHPVMNVRCVFNLVNESDMPVDVTVGFPIDAKFGDSYTVFPDSMLVAHRDSIHADEDRHEWFDTGFTRGSDAGSDVPEEISFTASADGVPLEVSYRSCRYNLEEEMIHSPVVAVWRMHFEPNQEVELVNTYSTSWDYYGGGPGGALTVRYVLTTGSTWKGPIGRAFITLEIPERMPYPQLSDSIQVCWDWSGSPIVDGRTVRWEFEDFEPEENLDFTIRTENIEYDLYGFSPGPYMEALPVITGDVLFTAGHMLSDETTWGQRYHRELVLRILEAVPYIARHMIPQDPEMERFFSSSYADSPGEFSAEDLKVILLIEELRSGFEAEVELAGDAGLLEFLPLFTVKYWWDAGDVDKYAAHPDMEEKYLRILGNLEAAMNGEELVDPEIEAFYRLTGWYNPGDSLWNVPDLTDSIEAYRESL